MTTWTKRALVYGAAGLAASLYVRKGWVLAANGQAWNYTNEGQPGVNPPSGSPPYFANGLGSVVGWPIELLARMGFVKAPLPVA